MNAAVEINRPKNGGFLPPYCGKRVPGVPCGGIGGRLSRDEPALMHRQRKSSVMLILFRADHSGAVLPM